MTEISFTSILTKAMPWLFALPVLALAAGALTAPEFARPWLLFPSLLVVALATLPLLQKHKPDLPLYTLAAALLFIGVLVANTAFNHIELLTPAFRNAVIMLILPFSLLLAGMLAPQVLLQNTKPLLLALLVLEVLLVGQIWYSYATGWGEIYDGRDGIRRAYGMAGDSYTAVLVFITLLSFIRLKTVRFALGFTALLMCGGKMGLILLVIGIALALPIMLLTRPHLKRIAMSLILALTLGFGLTSASLRATITPAQFEEAAARTAPPPAVAQILAQDNPKVHQNVRAEWSKRSLPLHLIESIVATGQGRIITFGAAITLFSQHPLTGVGYLQSADQAVFQPAVKADIFKLVERFDVHPLRLTAEKFIGNQTATIAAEQGLIGLVPFALFCLSSVLLSGKIWLQLKASKQEQTTQRALVTAACIWVFCLVIFNQTASWFVSGTCMTIWLGLALGLCAAAYRQQAKHA